MSYNTPESIDRLTQEIELAKKEFEFLVACKESGQPYGKHLDPLLEDSLAHLVDRCEELIFIFDDYIKKE